MLLYPKLYIGPMSKNIVDATIEFSNETKIPLGFCASRRQIEYDGGYVNSWTTSSLVEYVKSSSENVLVCRDHGGVNQGSLEDDGFDSFLFDAQFMDVIHIDPWKKIQSVSSCALKTIEYIEFMENISDNCLYEIGTEEAIRKMNPTDLYKFLKIIRSKLNDQVFSKILYVVIQSGTSLKEDRNTGIYDKNRLEEMISVCKEFGVLSKEHNGDYLNSDIIKEKFDLGLDAINIAPEFGVIETSCIMNRVSENDEVFNKIFKLCYESGKWRKWVDRNFDPIEEKDQLIKICCHYVFANEEFKELLALDIFVGVDNEIKTHIKNRIEEIVC